MFHVRMLAVLALLGPYSAYSQLLQGTIDGNVSDPSQAAVAGAKVTATNQDTSFTRDAVTNSAGSYSLPTLPPGAYTIKVTAPGFQTYTQTGVAAVINNVTRVDVTLTVGQVSDGRSPGGSAADGPGRCPHRHDRAGSEQPAGSSRAELPDASSSHGAGRCHAGQRRLVRRQPVARRAGCLQRRQRLGQQYTNRRHQLHRLQWHVSNVYAGAGIDRDGQRGGRTRSTPSRGWPALPQ